ncbi:hypothetical protein MUO14_20105 [Halobacillus shinanisalinarum]|uniref:Uncharacterized protein n=1 Tax=Halobacillus shinanisalinarum TaxID=2932258 RepID=A0ABY4GWZ6_9BACI|nr:hypothetical protein [Halobacillus shinanisalinarum]UOQ92697.1 hypothetical protein MUO14_20105 [Halobacillus shinanisalinarum]
MDTLETEQNSLAVGQANLVTGQATLEVGQAGLVTGLTILETGQVNLEAGQERIESKLDNLSSEMHSHFNHLEEKLEQHQSVFKVVSDEIQGTNIDIDYLIFKTGKHDI